MLFSQFLLNRRLVLYRFNNFIRTSRLCTLFKKKYHKESINIPYEPVWSTVILVTSLSMLYKYYHAHLILPSQSNRKFSGSLVFPPSGLFSISMYCILNVFKFIYFQLVIGFPDQLFWITKEFLPNLSVVIYVG